MRIPEANEEPTTNPKDGEIGIYTVLFEQARLRLPLNHLLCKVLKRCNMALCQLSPNGVRVVLGCFTLNKLLGVNMTHREIFWYYSLCHCPQDKSRYYSRVRIRASDLVKYFTKFKNGYYGSTVIIKGSWDNGDIHKIRRCMCNNVGKDFSCCHLAILLRFFPLKFY